MNSYLLNRRLTSEDVDFLNSTDIEFMFKTDLLAPYDSGWCDAATGARIIQASDRIIFHPATEEEEVFLKLKYMTELISDFL